MSNKMLKVGLTALAMTALCTSVPAFAYDSDMHHHMMRHEMRREMHHHMMHRMMRHEMHRDMRHRMMRHEMHHRMHDSM